MSYYRAWFHLFWRFIGWVIHHSARRTCQNEPQPQECVYETRRERRWPLAVGIASALCFFVVFFQRKIPVCCAHGIRHALSHLSLSFSFFLSFPSCPSIGIRWTSHHRESPFFFLVLKMSWDHARPLHVYFFCFLVVVVVSFLSEEFA